MVTLIKNYTKCKIIIGQNGVIWVKGEPRNEIIAIESIKMIERKSHLAGLADYIKNYLEKATKNTKQSNQTSQPIKQPMKLENKEKRETQKPELR